MLELVPARGMSCIPALFNCALRNVHCHKVSIRGVFLFRCLVPMDSDLHFIESETVMCGIFLVPRNFAAADLFGGSWQLCICGQGSGRTSPHH